MDHVFMGACLALGACIGMVAWQVLAWVLDHVKVIVLAILARLGFISPVQVNGKGERVFPNDPKGGGR